jgi:hypothetical protein
MGISPTAFRKSSVRMNCFRKASLLPHEWFFGIFLVILWVRLVVAFGPSDPDALLYFVLIVVNVLAIAWCRLQKTILSWRVRLWFYPVVMNVVFMNMKSSIVKIASHRWDELLAGFDKTLFGAILSVRAQAVVMPVLTEVLSFVTCYFFPIC